MIKIAYVVHGLETGGIERSVTRIVNRLDRDEFCPLIVCLHETGPASEWLEKEVPIVEIKKKPGNDVLAVNRLARCLRQHGIDIVQSHNWGTLIETLVARKLSRTPRHIHAERGTVLGMVQSGGMRHWLRAKAMSQALERVDKVISNAHAVAQRVETRCGYRADRIEIIPNGVPDFCLEDRETVRQRIRSQIGLGSDDVLIGSAGRLVEVKGFDLAITAFRELASKHRKVHLILIGDGPDADALRNQAEQLGVTEKVHFVGHQADVRPWLASLDVYLNSSRSEGMSQSIIEAMSAGLPIVATDVGDNSRTLGSADEIAGICVPALQADAMADALSQLTTDSTLRRSLSIQSRQRHQQYYSERQLKEHCQNVYRSLLVPSAEMR